MSDAELIQSYKKTGNTIFHAELFERYTHLVFGICMKYMKNEDDSKDEVMLIFEKLLADLHNQEIQNFKNWLYSVAKNHCLMALRKEKRIQKNKSAYISDHRDEFMESFNAMHQINEEKDVSGEKLKKGLEKLNDDQRTCIDLIYLQNKSYKEVTEITGLDFKKVKSHVQNGKRNLKIYLEK